MGASSIGIGRITDKYGPKVALIACGLFIGLGFLLMSQVNTLWQLYLYYGMLVGIAMGGSDIPIVATLARWFVRRRGMMTGIAKAGAGIGIMIVPPLATWLILSYGWRSAYTVIGITCLVVIVSLALLYRRDPGQISKLPDGDTGVEEVKSGIDIRQFSLREAIGTRQFWIFATVWFSFNFCLFIVGVHMVPHVTDVGISATIAATIISAIGGFSILGRLGLGGLSDSLGTKWAFLIAVLFLAASMILIQFAVEVWMFYLFAAIYGIAHGAHWALLSPMVAWLFGLRSLGVILGVVIFAGTIGGLISPVMAGRIFDITGSYHLAFISCLVLAVVSLVLMLLLRPTNDTILESVR